MLSFEMRESGYFYEVDSSYTWQDWVDSGDPGSEDFQVRRGTVTWLVWSEQLFYSDGSEVLPDDLIIDYVNDTGSSGGGGGGSDPQPPASGSDGSYIGVNGKARKITDIYIGVSGKARRVKKVYVGVNGKAKLCWVSESSGGSGPSTQTFTFEFEGYEYFAPIDITWDDWIDQGHPGSEDFHWNRGTLWHIPSGVSLDWVVEGDLIINTV